MISIITLTYNNLEAATKPFIESLFKYTNVDDFKLIVVDNNSTDGTVEYIKEIRNKYPNIEAIFNVENKGYSKGNNQGLRLAKGDYICLVNNDVLFTPNWLCAIIAVLQSHLEIGLVSPTVNQVGDSFTVKNYLEKSNRLIEDADKEFEYSHTASFCCVCLRRKVFEEVGFLDEAFTPAYYEDDDYCLRVLYKGYKNAILLNTFVFHNHCQTSGKLSNRVEIRKRNRLYFYDKHIIAQYIGQLRDANEHLKKKSVLGRLRRMLIEIVCIFAFGKDRKKKLRKKLEHVFS